MKTALERIHEAYFKYPLNIAKEIHAKINREEREKELKFYSELQSRGYYFENPKKLRK